MKKVVYLADETDANDLDRAFLVMSRRGIEARRVHPAAVSLNIDAGGRSTPYLRGEILEADLFVGWVFEEMLAPGLVLLETLELAGLRVLNPGLTLIRGQNKLLMSALLHTHGVRHLPIRMASSMEDIHRVADELSFPLVIKPAYVVCGGLTRHTDSGRTVVRADDMNALVTLADTLLSFDQPLYIQPLLQKPDRIIDVNVIGFELCTATHKYAAEGEWRTNLGRGATRFEDLSPTIEVRSLAEDAARAVGARISGVNIAETVDGPVVIEVNTCPTFDQYSPIYGDRIYDRVADLVEEALQG